MLVRQKWSLCDHSITLKISSPVRPSCRSIKSASRAQFSTWRSVILALGLFARMTCQRWLASLSPDSDGGFLARARFFSSEAEGEDKILISLLEAASRPSS